MGIRLLIDKMIGRAKRLSMMSPHRAATSAIRSHRGCLLTWASIISFATPATSVALGGAEDFHRLAQYTEVVSNGDETDGRVLIRIGKHTFFDEGRKSPQLAGLYLVASHEGRVLLQFHYNTLTTPGASEGLARDIEALPAGALVIVAAKGNALRRFDRRGQSALRAIGAAKGLIKQKRGSSYLCIGMKALSPGQAIERIGRQQQQFVGNKSGQAINLVFPMPVEPQLSVEPGMHEGVFIGKTEVIYYIPKYFDPQTARYLFGIHGAGDWHRGGALNRIAQFRHVADIENLVIVAPSFDCLVNWLVDPKADLDNNAKFKDRRIIKDWHLTGFQRLLNKNNQHRSDLKLIEVFEFLKKHLMQREKFHLYGHSGGGQFVNRFMLFHPELLEKVALSAAGTFTFPRRDKDYPWGLRMNNLEAHFGAQIEADDLRLSKSEWNAKINRLLDLRVFIIVGQKDTSPDKPGRLKEIGWQGRNHLEKARNYFAAMRSEHEHQKKLGNRSQDDPFRFELHELPGVGHASGEGADKAIELLFPVKPKRKDHVFGLAFENNEIQNTTANSRIESDNPPSITNGYASFVGRRKQYLRADLTQESDLLGCTEMTIRLRVRIDPDQRRHRFARIIQTSDNKALGTGLMVSEQGIVGWVQTTSPAKTLVGNKRRKGRSGDVKSKQPIDDGQWHDVALTYTGQRVKLYIDGKLHDQTDWKGQLINFDHLNIGYVKSNGFHYDGDLDEIQIFGRMEAPGEL